MLGYSKHSLLDLPPVKASSRHIQPCWTAALQLGQIGQKPYLQPFKGQCQLSITGQPPKTCMYTLSDHVIV